MSVSPPTETTLYPYQMRVAAAILHSLLVNRQDVFVKIARQAGKTETSGDVIVWFKYLHVPYKDQVEMMMADLNRKGYFGKIHGVRVDDTGVPRFLGGQATSCQ